MNEDELSRAVFPETEVSGDAGALALAQAQVKREKPPRDEASAGDVVAQLVLGQVEADEVLERRLGNGRANARIAQRIDRS